MEIEVLLKLQEEGKLPVDIRSKKIKKQRFTIIAVNGKVAIDNDESYLGYRYLEDYELIPENDKNNDQIFEVKRNSVGSWTTLDGKFFIRFDGNLELVFSSSHFIFNPFEPSYWYNMTQKKFVK